MGVVGGLRVGNHLQVCGSLGLDLGLGLGLFIRGLGPWVAALTSFPAQSEAPSQTSCITTGVGGVRYTVVGGVR